MKYKNYQVKVKEGDGAKFYFSPDGKHNSEHISDEFHRVYVENGVFFFHYDDSNGNSVPIAVPARSILGISFSGEIKD